MHPMLNIAIRAARKAGTVIIKSYENPNSIKLLPKAGGDFTTNVDNSAEQIIIEAIKKSYPNHTIIAKNAGLISGSDADTQWVIDPIDGTTNLLKGIPNCAVSIAVRVKGKTETSLVYNPMSNELFTAIRGQGSQLNGYRIRVSDQKDLQNAVISARFPSKTKQHSPAYFNALSEIFTLCEDFRSFGATSLDLCFVAAGRIDGFLALKLKPWQITAGELILREAGGVMTDLAGNNHYLNSGNAFAGNPKLVKNLITTSKPFWTDNLIV